MNEAKRIWSLCICCALRFPSPRAGATLLFGTAAQESRLTYRRQISFNVPSLRDEPIGAFSLWQFEPGSMLASLSQLRRNAATMERAQRFMRSWDGMLNAAMQSSIDDLLMLFQRPEGDPLACLFARLHYLRVPDPLPVEPLSQARYWEQHYNTAWGKGTVQQYMRNWNTLCMPVINHPGDSSECPT